ncbi:MAG: hypothetical protein RBQ97_10490 [Acholeplasma sp.]|jgi:predicted transcriptional regulator|nr:hypothetical protein [Acholeplasma sp.]
MKTTEINIGKEIEKILNLQAITKAEFARKMEITPQSADYLLKRSSIDVENLLKISRVLSHDFFVLYQKELHQSNFDNIKTQSAKVVVEVELNRDDIVRLKLNERLISLLTKQE